jgi:glutamate-5-semialdehyde dehydrogenase
VEHSLDRKVCNTVNVVCVVRERASELVPIVVSAADRAATRRGTRARIHAVGGAEGLCGTPEEIEVRRADAVVQEVRVTPGREEDLGYEFEWEENPEFHLVVVESIDHAVDLFNTLSPRFVASLLADEVEAAPVLARIDAPFLGDGFTRWVDGQYALGRPELGLSNWQNGRLLARSGILSGDGVATVRMRVRQHDPDVHR